jgi:UDPglucose 6-dehydrogenase
VGFLTDENGLTVQIGVIGLWHLGCVTAACLARKGFKVIGFDADPGVIENLRRGKAPIFEPGLDALIEEQGRANRLHFSDSMASAMGQADFIWITYDTPVDDHDQADVQWLQERLQPLFGHLRDNQAVLVSSQVPVGFCRELEMTRRNRRPDLNIPIGYSPENLRLGNALSAFDNPERVIIGIRQPEDRARFEPVLSVLSKNLVWMKTESAEMTKHALNSFLATSIAFANEVAVLCEEVGADAREVEQGLKTESRIGPRACLKPGAAFAGGTLARDVRFLTGLGRQHDKPSYLLHAVLESNENHKRWTQTHLEKLLHPLQGRQVTFLGLTYKAGTDTLRRSWSVELSKWLHAQGVKVRAFDWQLTELTKDLTSTIELQRDVASALERCDALVIGTDHPRLQSLAASDFRGMVRHLIVDPDGTLNKSLINSMSPLEYYSVGFHVSRKASSHEPAPT